MNTSPWRCITRAHTISSLHTCTGIALYTCSSSECMYIVHIVPSRAKTTQKHFGYNNNIGHLLIYTKILNMLKNNYNTNCQGNTHSEFVLVNGHTSTFKGEVPYIAFTPNSDGTWDCLVSKSTLKAE